MATVSTQDLVWFGHPTTATAISPTQVNLFWTDRTSGKEEIDHELGVIQRMSEAWRKLNEV